MQLLKYVRQTSTAIQSGDYQSRCAAGVSEMATKTLVDHPELDGPDAEFELVSRGARQEHDPA